MDMFYPEAPVNRRATAVGLDIMPATFGEGFGAAFADTLTRNPTASIFRSLERARYEGGAYMDEMGQWQTIPAVPSKVLTAEEANAQYGIKGRLTFDADTPEPVAKQLRELKIQEIERQTTMRRANAGIGTALSAGLLGSLLDPLNIGAAFIPVVGEARFAALVARLGVTGARVATGAIEGAAGAALLEPIVYGVAREEQADYTAVDSLLNIVFGTAIGGGLHLGAGYIGDRIKGRSAAPPLPRAIDNLPTQDQAALLRAAVAQVVEGRAVDVAPILDAAIPVADRATRIAEARARLAEIEGVPAFARTATDLLDEKRAQALLDAAGKLSPEMRRAVEIAQTPAFARTAEDRIFLAGLDRAAEADAPLRAKAAALMDKIERGQAPTDFAEAVQMAVARAGKDAVLAKMDEATQGVSGAERAAAVDRVVREIAEGLHDQALALDPRNPVVQGRVLRVVGEREAALRESVARAETAVDAADARAAADVTARTQEEIGPAKPVDDEITRVQEEVTELESYFPEGVEPTKAVKDAAKEATVYEKAWRAAASCLIRKA